MRSRRSNRRGKTVRGLAAGAVLAVGMVAGTAGTANAAVTASYSSTGTLSVFGDSLANNITISRNAAGTILVNGGAISVVGGTATVGNTSLIQVFGQTGNDVITMSETNGALPKANLFGGSDNDTLTGGSGGDLLFGQAGNDTALGKGGFDFLFGGTENDTLTGGDADDQVFGEAGDDRMIWNPGDDTDLNEGGAGTDTVQVNGGNGTEQFTTTANGTRVRFDRLDPAPFSIDIGTSENLVLNANGGDDRASATGNLAALIKMTTDGGTGNDNLLGSNGIDLLLGGDGNDFVDGQQGNDVAFLGAGDDTFQWDPGDGNDVIEGQAGTADRMLFNGSAIGENMDVSANGGRVRFTRNIAAITMDLDDVETINARTFGGADNVTVNDLSGTDVKTVSAEVDGLGGADDLAADNVIANATNGSDVITVTGASSTVQAKKLPATVSITGTPATDRLTVNALNGNDVIDGSAVAANSVKLTLTGGVGDDAIAGGKGDDVLLGNDGDDVLIGGPGFDTIDGGAGNNVVIDAPGGMIATKAETVGRGWIADHTSVENGKTVLEVGGEEHTLPRASL